jgi:hypothetical protein
MLEDGKLSDAAVGQIVGAMQAMEEARLAKLGKHTCRFDDSEAKVIHALADIFDKKGQDNLRRLLNLGERLEGITKAGQIALVLAILGAIMSMIWLGLLEKIKGNH